MIGRKAMRRLVSYDTIRSFNAFLSNRYTSMKMFIKVDGLYLKIDSMELSEKDERAIILHCSSYPEKLDVEIDQHTKIDLYFA